MAKSKKKRNKVKIEDQPVMAGVLNDYNRFFPDFLEEKAGRIMNGEFDVTDTPAKLYGVPTGDEEIVLRDYMVYRPVPPELLKWRDIPAHMDQHSLDLEDWYVELITYSRKGVWIDGEYWNPLMVYWLNVFVFQVYKLDEDGDPTADFDPGHPFYCNIDRYLFDLIWKAKITGKDFALMGGRGIGKSYVAGNVMDQEYRLSPGGWNVVSSTNEETTNEAWNKIEECLEAIEKKHKALKHKRISNSGSYKFSGEIIELPDGTTEKRGYQSKFEKIVYGKNGGKTRGKRPTIQLIEEFAAFPPSTQKGSLKACMRESRGSWYVGGSIKKCIVMYTGTGGTVENDEAEDIFMNPKAHEILPTFDWPEGERLNERGEKTGTGTFIPTHIKRSGTWEETGCPDIARATLETLEDREEKKNDPVAYMGLLQEYPMTIKEVFMRKGSNMFNQDKLAEQRVAIVNGEGPKPEKGFLDWTFHENGSISGVKWKPSQYGDISIMEHPHWLQEGMEGDNAVVMDNLYVAGCDSIDQGNSDSSVAKDNKTGSELAVLVKKRIVDKGYFNFTSNLYVAKYNKRSDNVIDDWDNAAKLSYYYNAQVNIEYTRINIVGHFRNLGMYDRLKKRPTINQSSPDPNKPTTLLGTTTSTAIIDYQDQKIAEYINNYYDTIWFLEVIEQCMDYNRDDRTKFDMVIAMGLCELSDEDLMGKAAKPPVKQSSGFQLFGFYTDPVTGYKTHGVIPDQRGNELERSLKVEAEKFNEHGGVIWRDTSDPDNPITHY